MTATDTELTAADVAARYHVGEGARLAMAADGTVEFTRTPGGLLLYPAAQFGQLFPAEVAA